MKWLPIEDAPKDSKHGLLVWECWDNNPTNGCAMWAWWSESSGAWTDDDCDILSPTHFCIVTPPEQTAPS
jgi:hypothetical protein